MRRERNGDGTPWESPGETGEVPGAALPGTLTTFLGYLLRRVFVQFSSTARDDDPDPRNFVVLDALAQRDWLSQMDLGEQLGINRTIMVSVIDHLERDGHVLRTRNPQNRRSYVLSLTDAGRAALRSMRRAVARRDKRLTAVLSNAEAVRFNELLSRLLPAEDSPVLRSTEYLVAQAHYRLRRLGDDKLAGSGLRLRHYGPLSALDNFGPCPQQYLAHHLAITEPAAAQVVEELVQAGLVQRGRDPHDRRRYALELTDLGRQRLKLVRHAADLLQAEMAEMLGPDDTAELRVLMLKLLGLGGERFDEPR